MNARLGIEGMHCAGCERLIEETASEIKGVNSIKVSYSSETAEVDFDPAKTSVAAIVATMTDLGYEANEINIKDVEKSAAGTAGSGRKREGIFGKLFVVGRR